MFMDMDRRLKKKDKRRGRKERGWPSDQQEHMVKLLEKRVKGSKGRWGPMRAHETSLGYNPLRALSRQSGGPNEPPNTAMT